MVELDNLEFCWEADTPPVLAITALQIRAGERIFIEGPSGSGKSTLLSLLAGVNIPRQGSIQVLDQPLQQMKSTQRDRFRADHIGYIFQMFNLIPYLSMVENVTLPCRFSALRSERALQHSGSLEQEAVRLLTQLDLADPALMQRPVTSLSVGQQQRVAAARALMGAPELLIADEPTSSLDTARREAFVQLLFEECKQTGSTLIFVSHDATLEPLFDRTVQLPKINSAAHTTQAREI